MKRLLWTLAGVILPSAVALCAPTTKPATKPAPKAPPAVMKILDRLEKAGKEYTTIRADIVYVFVDEALGDREERTGWVAYAKSSPKAPAKFRVQFATLRQGRGRKLKDKIDYAFDGRWLTIAKHRIKSISRYQVTAKGEGVEPTKLGQGPLPLPFGQKADDILRHFEATTRAVKEKGPPGTEYLRLATRRKYYKSINFRTLQMWIDPDKSLPVKMVSTDKNENTTAIEFGKIETNEKLDDKTFVLPKPLGWTEHIKRLKPGETLTP